MDDTSLDDFLASDSEADDDAGDTDESAPAADRGQSPDDTSAADSVTPATTTARWVGDGAACAVCDATAERLWESPDGLVCPSCKEW